MVSNPSSSDIALPTIIQGGMGAGVSNWVLARAVSRRGQLGVVSGTALDSILIRRLQDGDIGGHMRRAMRAFPLPDVRDAVLRQYLLPDGKGKHEPYKLLPMYKQVVSIARQQLTMLASFVEVRLAKEQHDGLVGINLLTKLQTPNLASLYGAMLGGVDFVLMGAGIPREIPGALDALAEHRSATIKFDVDGLAAGEGELLTFNPAVHGLGMSAPLKRPRFLAIVAAHSLATTLARKANGRVDGFVIEAHSAGGHNAPPRGALELTANGEPRYGVRDIVEFDKVREIGLPFWLAGGAGAPSQLARALQLGAAGIQVGTLFAYCDESGFTGDIKREVLARARRREVRVVTDPRASPTGYPFKVVRWDGDEHGRRARERNCDLGYLRTAYRREGGRIGYRCPAEPVADYVRKGGLESDTVGRQCICNGLVATIGHPQVRGTDSFEPPLITSGDDLLNISAFLGDRTRYTASDVLDYLLSR